MAETTINPAICPLLFLILLLPILPHPTIALKLELIHRDSPRSPLYDSNITSLERFRRLLDLSKARTASFGGGSTSIRPPVSRVSGLYMVLLSIGTPALPYFLQLDSGSDLSWIQCAPCHPCFNQSESGHVFSPAGSTSYSPLPCTDPICNTCGQDGTCSFHVLHPAVGGSVAGSLARENFTFLSNASSLETVPGVVFGCATSSTSGAPDGAVAGVLGLGRGPQSFIRQLHSDNLTTTALFAYCFIDPAISTYSYLRFGEDIKFGGGIARTTQLLFSQSTNHYYLDLVDITVGLKRLNLPPGTFDLRADGSGGGCVIDTGTPVSSLVRPAYDAVRAAFEDSIDSYGLPKTNRTALGLELEMCYRNVPEMFDYYPIMTLHLKDGVDMTLGPNAMAYADHDNGIFCLAMLPADKVTVLGAWQQQDTWFQFDALGSQLMFADADCSGRH